jgi:NodT family efflux transporter outer membrane factor (OMF) lipoprotein
VNDRFVQALALRSVLALALLALALAPLACARPAAEPTVPVEPPPAFSATGEDLTPDEWWTVFADPELDALVHQALEHNFTLRSAWRRLLAARSVARRESAALYPSLDGRADVEASSENGRDNGEDGDEDEGEIVSVLVGLSAEYEVDLWGRIGAAVEAEELRAEASFEDYRTAALTLSAEVARTWFRLLEAWSQWDLLQRQIEANTKILRLIKARFATGLVRSVDILRQQQLIEANRQQAIGVESRIAVLEHQLAVLVGQPPQPGIDYERHTLPALPRLPATGLPAELVARRPDVRRAHKLLAAADRDAAAAVSNKYPRLTLTAGLATTSEDEDVLLEDWTRNIAAGLVAPLLDGGRRRAEVERTAAVKLQRLDEYGQQVLLAFREVEDALAQEANQSRELESLAEQVRLAELAYERIQFEYLNGVRGYIDVLTTLTDEQQLRRDLIAARLALLEFRIGLYRALAGGFETPHETPNS